MILPFSNKFSDGAPTFFAEKIISSNIIKNESDFINFYMKKPDYYGKLIFIDTIGINKKQYNPKLHTIRTDEKNRWKHGNKIHAVYHNRSKKQFQFIPTFKCTGVQKIEIYYKIHLQIFQKQQHIKFPVKIFVYQLKIHKIMLIFVESYL